MDMKNALLGHSICPIKGFWFNTNITSSIKSYFWGQLRSSKVTQDHPRSFNDTEGQSETNLSWEGLMAPCWR